MKMADIEVKGLVRYQGDRYSVELARGQRGGYGWTIKVKGDVGLEVLNELSEVDAPRKHRVVPPQLAMFLDRPDLWPVQARRKPTQLPPKEQLALNLQEGGDKNGRH